MDPSVRGTAAQLAARQIKAKPKGRAGLQRVQGSPAPAAGAPGAMFGGSVPAAGGFNFSAPTPSGLAFPTFGGSMHEAPGDANADPRADTTGEEEARRGKQFRTPEGPKPTTNSFGISNTNNSFPPNRPQTQNVFGSTMNNTQSGAPGGGFAFGASAQNQNQSTGGFGFNSPASQAPNPFNFNAASSTSQGGASDNNTSAPPIFGGVFGGSNSIQSSKPAENAFNFTASQPQSQNNPFAFNSPAKQENSSASNPHFNSFSASQNFFPNTTTNSGSPFGSSQENNNFNSNLSAPSLVPPSVPNYFPSFTPNQNQSTSDQMTGGYQAGLSTAIPHQQVPTLEPGQKLSFPVHRPSIFGAIPMFSNNTSTQQQKMNEQQEPSSFYNMYQDQQSMATDPNYDHYQQQNQQKNQQSSDYFNNHNMTGPSFANSAHFQTQDTTVAAFSKSFGHQFGGTQNTNNASTSFTGFGSQPSTNENNNNTISNPFTNTQSQATTAEQPSSLFATAPSTSSNMFGSINAPPSSAPTSGISNIFGSTTAPPSSAPTSSNSNMFGAVTSSAPSNTNLFGTATSSAPLNASFLGSPAKPFSFAPTTTAPASQSFNTTAAPSTSSVFNQTESAPASNPFANLNQPKEPSTLNLFGNINKTNEQSNNQAAPAPATNIFGGLSKPANTASTPDLFGNLNKPVSKPVSEMSTQEMFSAYEANKKAKDQARREQLALAAQSSPKPSFASLPSGEPSSPFKPVEAPTTAKQPPPSGMFGSLAQPAPTPQNESPKKVSFGTTFGSSSRYSGTTNGATPATSGSQSNGYEAPQTNGLGLVNEESKRDNETREPTTEEMDAAMPANFKGQQRDQFHAAYRLRSLNKSMSHFFAVLPFGASPRKAVEWYNKKRDAIFEQYDLQPAGYKRAANEDENQDQENESPRKRSRQPEEHVRKPDPRREQPRARNGESPKKPRPTSQSQPQTNGNAMMNAPSLKPARETSPVKQSSRAAAAPESSPSKKRKPETQLTKDDDEEDNRWGNSSKKQMNGEGSSTLNAFKNILDNPEKPAEPMRSKSPERPIKPMRSRSPERRTQAVAPTAKEPEAPRANPFSNLPGAASPTKAPVSTLPSTTPVKPPTFALASTSTTPAHSPIKPPTFALAPNNTSTGNSIKPPTFAIAPNNTSTGGPIKPPSFGNGAPINFMAQFGQQAAKNAEDEEKKRMQKAKDEDFDSEDDDEAEWEANYKKKREAELKELKNLAEAPKPTFVPGKGFSFEEEKTEDKKTDAPKAASASIFPPVANAGAGESIFSSANISRTSTPGLFSSTTGSVLEGAAGKKPAFGSNIFGHLSDNSKDNDGDDESTDDEADQNTEKKDPSYKPNTSSGTPSTPGTPAEETGSGIASTKKPFSFLGAASTSGTTTPGGSLLSRMSKDTTADEPKINIFGNTATNPFASSTSSTNPGTPADKTWKPDTPIKFGSSTTSAPAVNVTESTPTKPFAGLFGNTTTSTSASSGGPTTVGFQFGGPSSTTSSLFPSALTSAGTSRATSPGATTDADNATDEETGKPHEQIDLTKPGPGEEDEENIHQVRAKALKFIPKQDGVGSRWETKGLGPLRVLRHKSTNATRILMRQDPSGVIVLNKSLISKVTYEAVGKTIKLMTSADDGKGLETWILQVKDQELAKVLASVLEENKVHN